MPYATKQDIIDRYGEAALIVAADHDGDGEADPAVVTQGLNDASEEIDAYVGGRCILPLNPVPPVLVRLCVDIALYRMSMPPAITDELRRRYEDAIKLLKLIADGTVTLGEKDPAGTGNAGGASFSSRPRVFTQRGC